MNTYRSMSSEPAPRRGPTARDEAAAWQELIDALRDYSAAVALLEQMTIDWLGDPADAGSPPVADSGVTQVRLDLAEATCALARRRCGEALARVDALDIKVDLGARIIPFPIERVRLAGPAPAVGLAVGRPSPDRPAAARPAPARPAPTRDRSRSPRRSRRPRLRLLPNQPTG